MKTTILCNWERSIPGSTRYTAPRALSQQAPWCFTKLLPVRSKRKTLLPRRTSHSLVVVPLIPKIPTLMKLQQPPSLTELSPLCLFSSFSHPPEKRRRAERSQKLPNCQTSVTRVSSATLFILHLHPLNLVNLPPYYQDGLFHTLLAAADGECSENPARHN